MRFKKEKWYQILPPLNIQIESVRDIAAAWTARFDLENDNQSVEYYFNDILGLVAVVGKNNQISWEYALGFMNKEYNSYKYWDFMKPGIWRFYYNKEHKFLCEQI